MEKCCKNVLKPKKQKLGRGKDYAWFDPGADLGKVLTDFLNECRRRKLLTGSMGSPQGTSLEFLLLKSPVLGFRVIQTRYCLDFNLETVFIIKNIWLWLKCDRFSVKRSKPVWICFHYIQHLGITWLTQWRNLTSLWRHIVEFIEKIRIQSIFHLKAKIVSDKI